MKQRYDSIMDIVDAVLPARDGLLVLMHAYFDGSRASGYLVVGGYVLRKSKVRAFEKRWQAMLDRYRLPYFHMTECNRADGIFAHLEDGEADLCAREAIEIIGDHVEHSYYTAIRQSDFDEVEQGLFPNSYTMGAYLCLVGVGKYVELYKPNSLVSFFFEAGDTGQGAVGIFLDQAIATKSGPDVFACRSRTFIDKRCSKPTQAADIFAWQISKHLGRMDKGLKAPRGDLKAMMNRTSHTCYHATKDNIVAMIEAARATAAQVKLLGASDE